MLCLIVILALATLTSCQTNIKTQSLFDQEERSNIPHLDKEIGTKDNKLSENYDLPQQFSSSKERPELNPVLSALINEDVKKNIEAKRQIEQNAEDELIQPTTFKPILTTTARPLSSSAELVNNGLVDQSISLDEAGSENKQTSRIQIKKGPNGVDYEYEYVYYYYDDDEKDPKKKSSSDEKPPTPSTTEQPTRSSGNKSRYTTLDRSGSSGTSTSAVPEQNEVISRGGKQRSSIPVVEEVSEERLPLITRFPPRSTVNNNNVTPAATSDETTKKISVKRPSIALVDSQSFNRDDKGSKGTRNLENEFSKSSDVKEVQKKVTLDDSTDSDVVDTTTPLMEKVAFDLYAILANENSNIDSGVTSVTTVDDETITDATDSDVTTSDDLTTIDSTLPTTSTTSTTTVPTTTTTTTTTTTSTSTEAPLVGGRKSPFAGRNRFRSRPQASSTERSASNEQAKEAEQQSHFKANRFSRPSFNPSNRANRPTKAVVVEEQAAKEETKPASNSSPIRGRTRNRFNLHGLSTTEAENAVDSSASTTQRSSPRPRPALQLRGRGRPTTPAAATVQNESGTAEQPSTDERPEEKVEEKATPTKPARFNVGRPNRLLGRSRTPALNNLKPQLANAESDVGPSASGESESTKSDDETNSNDGASTITETSTPETGLNRLRNRPRIQITASTPRTKAPAVAINRKVNPLIARRKLGGASTTQEPTSEEEDDGQSGNTQDTQYDAKEGEDYENSKESKKDATTEAAETSSEQPRGLGLLGNRRRLPIRRPGTLVTN